jgi:hypothetical protein
VAAKCANFRFHQSGIRVVPGALNRVLEPIFEADFQPGSFGYRPKKSARTAIPVFGPDAFECCLLRASIHALN